MDFVEVKNDLKFSPNPVHTTLQLEDLPVPCQIKIVDISGRVVFSGLAEGSDYQVNISEFTQGIYVVKAFDLERKVALSGKVVK